MQKVLQQLVELQELDTRLDELIEKLGDLPETVKTLEIQIDNEKEQNSIRKTSIEENDTLIRSNAAKIEDLTLKITKYKEQLFLVTTNREYDALTAEIEFNETTIKEAEDQVLQSEEENERHINQCVNNVPVRHKINNVLQPGIFLNAQKIGDRCWKHDDGRRKNRRNNTCCIHLQRKVRSLSPIHLSAHHPLGILHGNPSLPSLHKNDNPYHNNHENHKKGHKKRR